MQRSILILMLLSFLPSFLFGQENGPENRPKPKAPESEEEELRPPEPTGNPKRLILLPVLSYAPETSLRFGAIGVYLFRVGKAVKGTQLSSIKAPMTYTLNNQPKFRVSYEIFFNDNKHVFKGFTQWQRFPLLFWGVGPNTPEAAEELYTSRSFGGEIAYLNQVIDKVFIGGRVEWVNNKTVERVAGGLLSEDGNIPGSNGGIHAGLGLQFRYDNRDNNFNAAKGPFIESSLSTYQESFGSDFTFTKFTLDFREFIQPFKKHVLAFQFFTEYNWGDPSFEYLALMGGDETMRGHYEGRFRDKAYWAAQAEYRLPLGRKRWFPFEPEKLSIWERWGMVGFAGLGTVAPEFSDLRNSDLKYSLGLGLRYLILPKERVNIRIDFGFGSQRPAFYLNVREAF